MSPLAESLKVEKDRRGLILVDHTLQIRGYLNVFALGDVAFYPDVVPTLAGTAQLALQESGLCARNVRAFIAGNPLKTQRFVELGEAVSLGTQHPPLLSPAQLLTGPL